MEIVEQIDVIIKFISSKTILFRTPFILTFKNIYIP